MSIAAPTAACVVKGDGRPSITLSLRFRSTVGTKESSIDVVDEGAPAPKVKDEEVTKLPELVVKDV